MEHCGQTLREVSLYGTTVYLQDASLALQNFVKFLSVTPEETDLQMIDNMTTGMK
eukprot:CAMPEP_0115555174 /NCGR_PEP_ID=MMETSP0271-20121206/97686_1 /TAXON_ID=71861 /ORGANISM="Scrippsiella trochoidea, Strain CCMP3099" /LENGTH=54 /DNA_ID=CAMNT_0002988949 /DNA_START=107 /DNA_END=268 /DNA_ORIENTATION=+